MCLSIPGRIISFHTLEGVKTAEVDFGGAIRNISIEWVPEAKQGDYILVHVGTALAVIDEESAKESLAAFKYLNKLTEDQRKLDL